MQMTIYDAVTVGSRSNCVYPNPVTVTDADTMRQAAAFDHVCAAYKQNYRSVDNFLKADCLPMDCDNDHSDDPDDWLTPFDVAMDFPGVGMIFVYSRSHMKQKGKRCPRPRFHVYFICTETTNSEIYSSWKDRLIADYPYFDDGAKDSARFLFGVKNAAVEVYDGEITIDAFLADHFAEWDEAQGQIPEGSRNKTMSHYAGRIIKRLGNTEEAHKQFLKEAEKCSPPLDDAELAGIWASAVKFGAKVAAQEGYIPPEQYNQDFLLMPEDFSDVGQAIVLSREYMDRLRFSPATDYIVFNGSFWEESQPNAQGIAQELTARQLEEAETEIQRCMKEMSENGAWAMLAAMGAKKAMAAFSEAQRRSFEKYERAENYRKYAIKRRDTKYISAALKEARPMIQIEQRVLDADEFLLNLPSGTWYGSSKSHSPRAFSVRYGSSSGLPFTLTVPSPSMSTHSPGRATTRFTSILLLNQKATTSPRLYSPPLTETTMSPSESVGVMELPYIRNTGKNRVATSTAIAATVISV